jgi:hypothetical protein
MRHNPTGGWRGDRISTKVSSGNRVPCHADKMSSRRCASSGMRPSLRRAGLRLAPRVGVIS